MLIHYEEYMSVCNMSFVLDLIFTVHWLGSSFYVSVYFYVTIHGRSTIFGMHKHYLVCLSAIWYMTLDLYASQKKINWSYDSFHFWLLISLNIWMVLLHEYYCVHSFIGSKLFIQARHLSVSTLVLFDCCINIYRTVVIIRVPPKTQSL